MSRNTNTRLSAVSEDVDSLQGSIRPERKYAKISRRREDFSEEETKMLLDAGKDLLRIKPDRLNEIFEKELHRFDVRNTHSIEVITPDNTSSRSGSIRQASGETSGKSQFDLGVWIAPYTRRRIEYFQ